MPSSAPHPLPQPSGSLDRRSFLRACGAGALLFGGGVLAACERPPRTDPLTVPAAAALGDAQVFDTAGLPQLQALRTTHATQLNAEITRLCGQDRNGETPQDCPTSTIPFIVPADTPIDEVLDTHATELISTLTEVAAVTGFSAAADTDTINYRRALLLSQAASCRAAAALYRGDPVADTPLAVPAEGTSWSTQLLPLLAAVVQQLRTGAFGLGVVAARPGELAAAGLAATAEVWDQHADQLSSLLTQTWPDEEIPAVNLGAQVTDPEVSPTAAAQQLALSCGFAWVSILRSKHCPTDLYESVLTQLTTCLHQAAVWGQLGGGELFPTPTVGI